MWPFGSLLKAGGAGLSLETTITAAHKQIYTTTPSTYPKDVDADGFDAGSDYYAYPGTFGSIADANFSDALGQPRTIDSCYWTYFGETLYMVLSELGLPNNNTVFSAIWIDGVEFRREDALWDDNVDGGTAWWWYGTETSPLLVAENDHDFEVWIGGE